MRFIQELANSALKDKYLQKLIEKAEHIYGLDFLKKSVDSVFTEKEYIDIASQVAEGHHEKWDGSGYPKGLKGTDIPIGARIMAVADVFDALISKRRYKEPMSIDQALDIIKESGGSHFDPQLAIIFCNIKNEITQAFDT